MALKLEAPQYATDFCRQCHADGMGPDDWRYETIETVLTVLHDDLEDDASEERLYDRIVSTAFSCADDYNARRTAWLASNLTRADYVDVGVFDQIAVGQEMEAREVFNFALSGIADILESGAAYRYVAGWNTPGYLPECEPERFLTFEDAKDHIAAELEYRANCSDDEDDQVLLEKTAREVSDYKEPFDMRTPYVEKVVGLCYWIEEHEFTIDENAS